jgi:hypothetical protein
MPFEGADDTGFDYPDYEDIRVAQRSFESLATFLDESMNLTGEGAASQ